MLLYQNMILRESGKTRDAIKHLTDYSKFITDKVQVKELQGEKVYPMIIWLCIFFLFSASSSNEESCVIIGNMLCLLKDCMESPLTCFLWKILLAKM